jgi:hypothetical protein
MRQAPCIYAAPVQHYRRDVVIPANDTFQYLDRNSRQSSDCAAYNLDSGLVEYCWILASYKGASGWVPVQQMPIIYMYTSALCTYYSKVPTMLVSDDGSPTGCAQLTKDPRNSIAGCFPADAIVYLRTGAVVRMRELKLGDEVAVRTSDGSIGYEPVYAFGHRDDETAGMFVEVTVAAEGSGADGVRTVQVSTWQEVAANGGLAWWGFMSALQQ